MDETGTETETTASQWFRERASMCITIYNIMSTWYAVQSFNGQQTQPSIHPCYTPARQSSNVNRRRNKHLSVALSPHELFNLVCDGHSNCDFYRNKNIIIIRLTLTLERPSNVVLNLSPRQIRDKVKPYGRLSVGQQTWVRQAVRQAVSHGHRWTLW